MYLGCPLVLFNEFVLLINMNKKIISHLLLPIE
jgi:hypothetical protein